MSYCNGEKGKFTGNSQYSLNYALSTSERSMPNCAKRRGAQHLLRSSILGLLLTYAGELTPPAPYA